MRGITKQANCERSHRQLNRAFSRWALGVIKSSKWWRKQDSAQLWFLFGWESVEQQLTVHVSDFFSIFSFQLLNYFQITKMGWKSAMWTTLHFLFLGEVVYLMLFAKRNCVSEVQATLRFLFMGEVVYFMLFAKRSCLSAVQAKQTLRFTNTVWPPKKTTHKNANYFYICRPNYFIFGLH